MTSEPDGLPIRRSGRVLLVDGQERLLLFRANGPGADGNEREVWFPPGGGFEAGETFVDCAVRELFEETGLRVEPDDLGPVVAVRSGPLVLDGMDIWADEAFFFVRVHSLQVDISGFTELEREVVTAHRWWSLPQLAASKHLIFPLPEDLVALVSRLLTSGPPSEPVQLAWERQGI